MKNLIKKSYEQELLSLINKNGGAAKSPEDIWSNIKLLATKYTKFDKEILVLPLQVKKMLAYLIDPDFRIEYAVENGDGFCAVEAKLYWSDKENPCGVGFVKRYLSQIFPNDGLTSDERNSYLESSARGMAASRALTDAGIGLQFYGDLFDSKYEELECNDAFVTSERTETKNTTGVVPEIPSAEEKKAARVAKKATVKTEESRPVAESKPTPTTTPAIDIEVAKKAVCDIGCFAGNILGDIYNTSPRNLIWLINNGSAVANEARVIVESDAELAGFLQ